MPSNLVPCTELQPKHCRGSTSTSQSCHLPQAEPTKCDLRLLKRQHFRRTAPTLRLGHVAKSAQRRKHISYISPVST